VHEDAPQGVRGLAHAETVGQLLPVAARALTELLEADACAISRVVGDVLVDVADYSPSGRSLSLGQGYLISDYPLTREVVEEREPRIVSRTLEDDPDPKEAALLGELGFDALLMAPLEAGDEVWALVEVYSERPRRFETQDIEAATTFLAEVTERLVELGA
jgi:GAF domain-containing protein